MLVENKGGASGMIGSEMVVKSPPDGYTLLFAPNSHATLKELYPTMPFDPLRDFTPIATVARTPYILVVHPGLEVKTVALVRDLPTLRELDLDAAEIEGWFIVLGPAGVPDAVVQRLNAAINKVLAAPATAEKLATLGAEPLIGPPQDVTTLVAGDRERWGKVIRDGNIKPE